MSNGFTVPTSGPHGPHAPRGARAVPTSVIPAIVRWMCEPLGLQLYVIRPGICICMREAVRGTDLLMTGRGNTGSVEVRHAG
jgi:hypothetical protein